MHQRGLIILIFTLYSFLCVGQESSDFSFLDRSTYEFYVNKNWKNLIDCGKQGLNNGFDYYYLRMRMGIAFYELNQYRKAIPHFHKALKFSDKSPLALEYLYYSYLFSGRTSDSRFLVSQFPNSLKNNLSVEKKTGFHAFSIDNTFQWNPDFSEAESFIDGVNPTVDGYQLAERNLNLLSIRFNHQLGYRLSIQHGYGFLSKIRNIAILNDVSPEIYSDDRFRQFQVFLLGNYLVSRGFDLNLTVHYLNLRPRIYQEVVVPGGPGSATYESSVVNQHNWVGYFSGNIHFGLLTLSAGAGVSNLNGLNQVQKDLSVVFYPIGNLNFYTVSKVIHQGNYYQNRSYDRHFIFDQTIGFKTFNPLWVEITGALGNIANFFDYNGTVIYNDLNPIKFKTGISFLVPFVKKGFEFSIRFNYQEIESQYFSFSGVEAEFKNPFTYVSHSITGGIKWNILKN